MRLTNLLHRPFDLCLMAVMLSKQVRGPLACSSGTRGQRVNRLSAAQESFRQDRECSPTEILESSEARDGE